jgi:hypothetical protein
MSRRASGAAAPAASLSDNRRSAHSQQAPIDLPVWVGTVHWGGTILHISLSNNIIYELYKCDYNHRPAIQKEVELSSALSRPGTGCRSLKPICAYSLGRKGREDQAWEFAKRTQLSHVKSVVCVFESQRKHGCSRAKRMAEPNRRWMRTGSRCRPSWTSRIPDPEGRESAASFPCLRATSLRWEMAQQIGPIPSRKRFTCDAP